MFYVKVTGDLVTDRTVFNEPMPVGWPDYASWHQNDETQIGWSYDGEFHPPAAPRIFNDAPIMGGTIRELITGGA